MTDGQKRQTSGLNFAVSVRISVAEDDRRRAEFMMKSNSDDTWINAANTGFSSPKAAKPTPTLSRLISPETPLV
jgi:hypothetical protein